MFSGATDAAGLVINNNVFVKIGIAIQFDCLLVYTSLCYGYQGASQGRIDKLNSLPVFIMFILVFIWIFLGDILKR